MTTIYPRTMMQVIDLQLGDVISMALGDKFNTALIVKIDKDSVHFFRPYAITGDFSYSGGVIAYIGVETGTLWRDSLIEYMVLERKELR